MGQFSVLSYWRSYDHFKIVIVTALLSIIGHGGTTEGLRMCYNCSTTTSGLDCLYNPGNVTDGEIRCKGFCTILRKAYITMPEDFSLISLQRSCEKDPLIKDEVVVDGYFKSYYRSCKRYLCNAGLGIQSLRDIPIDLAWDLYTDEEEEGNKQPMTAKLPPLSLLMSISVSSILFSLYSFHVNIF